MLITTLLLVLLLAACAALILGYFRLRKEVDARRSIERTLRTQSRLRSEVLDLVPFPITIRDQDGVYVDLNSATANFMGLTREVMIGSTVDQCIALADLHALPRNQVLDAIHARSVCDGLRVDYHDLGGHERHGLHWNRPVHDESGTLVGWVGAVVDVTDVIESERKVQETEARLHDVTQNLPATVFQMRRESNGELDYPFVGGNTGLLPAFPASLHSRTAAAHKLSIETTDVPRLMDMIAQSARTLEPIAADFARDGANGAAWLRVNAIPRLEPDGAVLWNGYWNDVTPEHQRMIEIEAARDAAERASASKDQFLAMMSHEIRTPMSGVLGLVEVLAHSELQGEQIAMVSMIHDSAGALLQILDDILDYSKIEAAKLEIDNEPFAPREICDLVMGLLSARAHEKGLRLRCHVTGDVAAVLEGDSGRLRQVLFNLLGNAIKFTSTGSVTLFMGVDAQSDARQTLRIEVRDTGIGIDSSRIPALFSPFVQADSSTSRRYGGTGLGLAISSRLMTLMGGTLELTSEPGVGTCVTAHLPLPVVRREAQDCAPLKLVASIRVRDAAIAEAIAGGLQALGVPVIDASANTAIEPSVVFLDDGEPMPTQWSGATAIHVTERAKAAGYRRTQDDIRISVNPLSTRGLRAVCRLAAGDIAAVESKVEVPHSTPPSRTRDEAVRDNTLILVAEDNPVSRHLIQKQLDLIGCACDAVEDGEKALAALQNNSYAILITDCHMPIVNGYSLTEQIREREQHAGNHLGDGRLPIVGLTASVEASERERCIAAGMDDCMRKPAQLDTLRACLSRWAPRCLMSSTEEPAAAAPSDADPTSTPAQVLSVGDEAPLPPLDWKAICGSHSAAERDQSLIDVVGKSLNDDADKLQTLMHKPEAGALRDWIHRVSGTAMFLHFQPLADALDAFRADILAGEPPVLKNDQGALENAFDVVLAKLRRISAHLARQ